MDKKYYEAYNERYKAIHEKGFSWSSEEATPIVLETIKRYVFFKDLPILEIGCGEGRDSKAVLDNGYHLLATDISDEAIEYCKEHFYNYRTSFSCLDCLSNQMKSYFSFIYSVAVIHMLVLDEDRKKFYDFIYDHLNDDGVALICSMGDGTTEFQTDIKEAFDLQKRKHESEEVLVAATSCRMVSFETFEKEISQSNLKIIEKGITSSLPDFDKLMFAIVRKQ